MGMKVGESVHDDLNNIMEEMSSEEIPCRFI